MTLGHLQFWLQGVPNKDRPEWMTWLGNRISDLRYWTWRLWPWRKDFPAGDLDLDDMLACANEAFVLGEKEMQK